MARIPTENDSQIPSYILDTSKVLIIGQQKFSFRASKVLLGREASCRDLQQHIGESLGNNPPLSVDFQQA